MSRNPSFTVAVPALQAEAQIPLLLQLSTGLRYLKQHITLLPEPYSCCVLFLNVAAPGTQARVFFVRRPTLEAAWREGATRVRQWAWMRQLGAVELRVYWPTGVTVIGSRLPPLCQWQPASNWALADDGLEHAELLAPVTLPRGDPGCLGSLQEPGAATASFATLAEVNLLLRLKGLHIGSDGMAAELPEPAPEPLRVALQPTGQGSSALRESHASPTAHCDRLCVNYALRLVRHHAAQADSMQAGLLPALEQAFACLEKNLGGLRARADAAYIDTANCLLMLTRCLSTRAINGALGSMLDRVKRLTQALDDLNNAKPTEGKS